VPPGCEEEPCASAMAGGLLRTWRLSSTSVIEEFGRVDEDSNETVEPIGREGMPTLKMHSTGSRPSLY
jgi:hypothetical protein